MIDPGTILSRRQPDDRASNPSQKEAMPTNRHDAKTEPSGIDEEQATILDDMEPIASTPRQLGFMPSQAIATAELRDDFADDINDIFSC